MTMIKYDSEYNHFIINIGNSPIIISTQVALDLQIDLNREIRKYSKEKKTERMSLKDEVVAKTIISQKKETKGFHGLKSKDFGL